MDKIKEQRSGMASENIQELIDAEDSAKWTTLQGANQYETPESFCKLFAQYLPNQNPASIMDPQCARGNTVTHGMGYYAERFGIEIDNRMGLGYGVKVVTGNCVRAIEIMDELFPSLVFECVNANPPFGKRWKMADGSIMDSTEFTWNQVIKRGCFGYFISNWKTIERLGIDKHPWVYKYEKFENVWKNCEVVIGVVWWKNPDYTSGKLKPSERHHLRSAWDTLDAAMKEEAAAKGHPLNFNIWLDAKGKLKTYLSTITQHKHKLTRDDILRLDRIKGTHPLTLVIERETRKLLAELLKIGFYTIEPKARKAIEDAIKEVNELACPIMPTTDFEKVSYTEELDHLECIKSAYGFFAGKKYEFSTATYSWTSGFTRNKVHFNEETGQQYSVGHNCELSGQDRYIQVVNEECVPIRFMEHPTKGNSSEHNESLLWEIFKKPEVRTVAEVLPYVIEKNLAILATCEMMAGYEYYPGQRDYLSRVAAKNHGLIGAGVGTGKSLFAITLIALKAPTRALIVAPQGTMKGSDEDDEEDSEQFQASQWVNELRVFAPYLQVFELFSREDYNRILNLNGGKLPPGVYVSYFSAFFANGGRETGPDSWNDAKLEKVYEKWELGKLPPHEDSERGWVKTIGKEVDGIRCIAEPCLSTSIGDQFDAVFIDESHVCKNLSSQVCQMMIRLQPKYRYAMTATPISNVVSDIFPLMGWLCVPDWYKGDRRNAAWPYAREDLQRFDETFRAEERDYTEEEFKKASNKDWRGKCVKISPVISSPARLLKILKTTLSFISKEMCNPNMVPLKVVDVRVPMGKQQSILYRHFLNRANIPCKNPLIRARKQTAYLRNICADPAGFDHGGPMVDSNFNPKTVAILELTREILSRGEQVVIICARVGQSTTIERRLIDAGVPISRIDSTTSADNHSHQSNLFKSGKTRVMIMGIKCAVGHSYPDCPNEIIGSLEYSYGSKHQAEGRVYRVNSKKPVTIYCILHKHSIEELIYDCVSVKGDSAAICLYGQRVPRDFKPVDMSEVLANAVSNFTDSTASNETDCESQWVKLRDAISKTKNGK